MKPVESGIDMMTRTLLPVFFLLALAACSGPSTNWVKQGATEAQVRADQTACRRAAERAGGRNENVTRDIRSVSRGGREDTRAIVNSTRDLKSARSFDRLFARCMGDRGYTQPKS